MTCPVYITYTKKTKGEILQKFILAEKGANKMGNAMMPAACCCRQQAHTHTRIYPAHVWLFPPREQTTYHTLGQIGRGGQSLWVYTQTEHYISYVSKQRASGLYIFELFLLYYVCIEFLGVSQSRKIYWSYFFFCVTKRPTRGGGQGSK